MRFLLLVLMTLLPIVASAYDAMIDGICYILYEVSGAAAVTSYDSDPSNNSTAYKGTIVIPQSIEYNGKEYEVRSIGSWAFYGCCNIISVIIPDNIIAIGSGAFSGCSSLTSVIIPNRVTTIGEKTFENCSGLTSVSIGRSVSSVNKNVFSGCINITSVTLHTFADMAFNNKLSIKDVFGEQVEEYIIGPEVTSVSAYTFAGCSKLSSLTLSDGVESIGGDAFWGCVSLTSITIPNSVMSIGGGAFSFCSGLTSISLGSSITKIGGGAFTGCSSLSSINIPSSVTDIGNYIFDRCISLASITVESGNKKYDSRENCNAIVESNSNILKHGCMNTTIPQSITAIGAYAFYNCLITAKRKASDFKNESCFFQPKTKCVSKT